MHSFANIVLVTGTPGARTYKAVEQLICNGYNILWPGQELLTEDARRFYEYNKQNIEVHNIHKAILAEHDVTDLFTDSYPAIDRNKFLLDPVWFFTKFPPDARIAVSDNLLAPFLSLWAPFAAWIIDIIASEEQDMRTLASWVNAPAAKLTSIRNEFITRREETINVWRHKVMPLKDEQLDSEFKLCS